MEQSTHLSCCLAALLPPHRSPGPARGTGHPGAVSHPPAPLPRIRRGTGRCAGRGHRRPRRRRAPAGWPEGPRVRLSVRDAHRWAKLVLLDTAATSRAACPGSARLPLSLAEAGAPLAAARFPLLVLAPAAMSAFHRHVGCCGPYAGPGTPWARTSPPRCTTCSSGDAWRDAMLECGGPARGGAPCSAADSSAMPASVHLAAQWGAGTLRRLSRA